jgi:hypothetical protein
MRIPCFGRRCRPSPSLPTQGGLYPPRPSSRLACIRHSRAAAMVAIAQLFSQLRARAHEQPIAHTRQQKPRRVRRRSSTLARSVAVFPPAQTCRDPSVLVPPTSSPLSLPSRLFASNGACSSGRSRRSRRSECRFCSPGSLVPTNPIALFRCGLPLAVRLPLAPLRSKLWRACMRAGARDSGPGFRVWVC